MKIRLKLIIIIIFLFQSLASNAQNVVYFWSGAITHHSAKVNAKISENSEVRLVVSKNSNFSDKSYSKPDTAQLSTNNRVVSLSISGLDENTTYFYRFEIKGNINTNATGEFQTFKKGVFSFKFALSNCARTGSEHEVFNTIKNNDPLFYLLSGDLHYEDINTDDISEYRSAYNQVLSSQAQSSLYRTTPIAYMWDDHDFGPNNGFAF